MASILFAVLPYIVVLLDPIQLHLAVLFHPAITQDSKILCGMIHKIISCITGKKGRSKWLQHIESHCQKKCAHEKLVEIPDTERRADGRLPW